MIGKSVVRFATAFMVIVLAACSSTSSGSSSSSSSGSSGGTSGTSGTTSGTFSCCLNKKGYSCPDKAAFDKCAGFDVGGCMAACAGNPQCNMSCVQKQAASSPDPSSCTATNVACGGSWQKCGVARANCRAIA